MLARLFGIRVHKDNDVTLVCFPWWVSDAMVQRAADKARPDAELQGKTVTVGRRTVKVQRAA